MRGPPAIAHRGRSNVHLPGTAGGDANGSRAHRTSPVPKKDWMGMDYIPVYEGEEQDDGKTVKVKADWPSANRMDYLQNAIPFRRSAKGSSRLKIPPRRN